MLAFVVLLVLQLSGVCNVRWRQHGISDGVKSMFADVQLKNYSCSRVNSLQCHAVTDIFTVFLICPFSISLWLQLVFHSTFVCISCSMDAWITSVTLQPLYKFSFVHIFETLYYVKQSGFSVERSKNNLFRHMKGLKLQVVAFMNLWNFVLIHFWYFVERWIIGWWVWRDMKDIGTYFELSVVIHGTLWYPERYFVGQQVCSWGFDLLLAA